MDTEDQVEKAPGPIFIGVSGKKQTGKDTSAAIITSILERRGVTVQTTAFADPLKQMCVDILGLTYDGVFGTDEQKNEYSHIVWNTLSDEIRYAHSVETEEMWHGDSDETMDVPLMRTGPMTNREVLQIIGTDIFRIMLYGNVWLSIPFRRTWDTDVVIIADVRFENEKTTIEENGGSVLRLTRNTGLLDDGHSSEVALDGVQFEHNYQNDGTIPELADFLDRFLGTLIGGEKASRNAIER
jgi:hypothetical protein